MDEGTTRKMTEPLLARKGDDTERGYGETCQAWYRTMSYSGVITFSRCVSRIRFGSEMGLTLSLNRLQSQTTPRLPLSVERGTKSLSPTKTTSMWRSTMPHCKPEVL
jgi:hypothetical protein